MAQIACPLSRKTLVPRPARPDPAASRRRRVRLGRRHLPLFGPNGRAALRGLSPPGPAPRRRSSLAPDNVTPCPRGRPPAAIHPAAPREPTAQPRPSSDQRFVPQVPRPHMRRLARATGREAAANERPVGLAARPWVSHHRRSTREPIADPPRALETRNQRCIMSKPQAPDVSSGDPLLWDCPDGTSRPHPEARSRVRGSVCPGRLVRGEQNVQTAVRARQSHAHDLQVPATGLRFAAEHGPEPASFVGSHRVAGSAHL